MSVQCDRRSTTHDVSWGSRGPYTQEVAWGRRESLSPSGTDGGGAPGILPLRGGGKAPKADLSATAGVERRGPGRPESLVVTA